MPLIQQSLEMANVPACYSRSAIRIMGNVNGVLQVPTWPTLGSAFLVTILIMYTVALRLT